MIMSWKITRRLETSCHDLIWNSKICWFSISHVLVKCYRIFLRYCWLLSNVNPSYRTPSVLVSEQLATSQHLATLQIKYLGQLTSTIVNCQYLITVRWILNSIKRIKNYFIKAGEDALYNCSHGSHGKH